MRTIIAAVIVTAILVAILATSRAANADSNGEYSCAMAEHGNGSAEPHFQRYTVRLQIDCGSNVNLWRDEIARQVAARHEASVHMHREWRRAASERLL